MKLIIMLLIKTKNLMTVYSTVVLKLNTAQFNLVSKSHYGNGCEFKHGIIEYRGNNCFVPTKEYCFIKCVKFLTGEDYNQQYFDFIRNEKRRSNIMTKARFQPFCGAKDINFGFFDGIRVFPRTVIERNIAIYL